MTGLADRPTAPPAPQASHSLGARLSSSRWLQGLEIMIVFSPLPLAVLAYRMANIENPMIMIAAAWVANVAMLGMIWAGIRLRGETWQSIGLYFGRAGLPEIRRAVLKSIAILVFAVAAFILGAIVMANLVGIQESADLTKFNYLQGNLPMLLISLAGVYFVSSFGEEVIYRGFLITRLQGFFGTTGKLALAAVLVLSAVVFGLIHFEWGATGIVQTACMGAALGASFLWTKRSLWPLILAHGYMDTLLLVQLYMAA